MTKRRTKLAFDDFLIVQVLKMFTLWCSETRSFVVWYFGTRIDPDGGSTTVARNIILTSYGSSSPLCLCKLELECIYCLTQLAGGQIYSIYYLDNNYMFRHLVMAIYYSNVSTKFNGLTIILNVVSAT